MPHRPEFVGTAVPDRRSGLGDRRATMERVYISLELNVMKRAVR